jgi:hypothetical protein
MANEGLATTTLAHKWLTVISGTTFTATATSYAQMHVGNPGAAGTANPVPSGANASIRKALSWGAPSSGSMAAVATFPSWTSWDAGAQTLTSVSVWDAAGTGTPATGGNFYFSAILSASKAVSNGDTFNLTSLSIGLTPLAAA